MKGATAAGTHVVIALVQRRPGGVVAIAKGAGGDVELVAEDQVVRRAVDIGLSLAVDWEGVYVDPASIDSAQYVARDNEKEKSHYYLLLLRGRANKDEEEDACLESDEEEGDRRGEDE